MDDKKKKQIILVVGSLFVAISFITSTAAFGNNNAQSSATTSIANVKTYFVAGSVNAIVSGYGATASVTVSNQLSNGTVEVGNVLSNLNKNGSISNYIVLNNSFEVFLGNINAYQLQSLLFSNMNASLVNVTATTYLTIPQSVPLYYNTQVINVHTQPLNYSVGINPLISIGSNVPVTVQALVVSNGTVYNNNIKLIPS